MKRTKMLGSYVDGLTMVETLNEIKKIIQNKIPKQHVVINASKINLMAKDKALREIINACPLINADGQSIVMAGKFLGHEIPERVTGIDLFMNLIELCAREGYKPYYFGATQKVVEEVVTRHKCQYPELEVAGYRNGYFEEFESGKIASDIRESRADILFVAFSSPKKEFWIDRYLDEMNVPFAMGVGGSFDVIAGKTKRAPKWMQKSGLEWFYRFIQEPRRMFGRYVKGNIAFLIKVIKEKLGE
ncbi:WecB/TagA/CpsF family glycosyltransferase [Listeria booriae]|uniref:WecB/TagA/CpsF family glycosyltransferase n=1 Tax=Listeria booriae TaxID=1552123 RepID=UPI001625727F|nr:WecB/TagA/CpsF family glycosyltransferase [Listeria booriae]MBC2370203.1 WecB/TagA/CpsF family glycosyltransferase [Listeria booriae]